MTIWRELYFTPRWQTFFNMFNSIPIALVLLAVAIKYRHEIGIGFSSGLLLHYVTDFFTHQEDAHAHFWPFSDWTFHSPISYWRGAWFSWMEIIAVVGIAVWMWSYLEKWWSKTLLVLAAESLLFGHMFWMFMF